MSMAYVGPGAGWLWQSPLFYITAGLVVAAVGGYFWMKSRDE